MSDRLALYQCFVLISTLQKTVLVPLFALKQDITVGKQNYIAACTEYESCVSLHNFHICIHRGSYMSANVLLNLLNELGKRDKMRGLPSILSLFRNEFNKFNNTRARMLDSIHHMALRSL